MKPLRRIIATLLSVYLILGPNVDQALAAVDAETVNDPLTSGLSPSGAGTSASGLESFKTDLFTGSASFSVPMEVPPGTGGMQPSLQLAYSSGAGNGWAGYGWTLDLGHVSRRTKNGVPQYDPVNEDVFEFNSTPLKKDSQGDYHTEIQSFLRIRHLTSLEDHWEVESKDGKTLFFGSTADSRIADPADPTRIFAWLLDRVEDPFGNFLLVSYHDAGDTGVLYPKTITYTWHSSSPGGSDDGSMDTRRRVDFCLEGDNECDHAAPFADRPDPIISYVSGFEQRTSRRLAGVRVALADAAGNVTPDGSGVVPTGVRWYDLQYEEAPSGRSRLIVVTQKSADRTESLPALTFTYQDLAAELGPPRNWVNPSTQKHFRPLKANGKADYTNVDMSGDGLPDRVVEIPTDDAHWNVYLNKGDGTGFETTLPLWENPSGISNAGQYTLPRETDGPDIVADLIDMDGDGLPDRVVQKKNDQDPIHPDATWWHVYRNGYPSIVGFESIPLDWYNPSGTASNPQGLDYGKVRTVLTSGGISFVLADVMDLDGDGLVDRMGWKGTDPVENKELWWFYKNTGSGFVAKPDWLSPSSGTQSFDNDKTYNDLIDMNGDGLLDAVVFAATKSGFLLVYFNNGIGFESEYEWPNLSNPRNDQPSTPNGKTYNCVRHNSGGHTTADIFDINGDGLPDRVTESNNSSEWVVYLNYGMGFGPGALWINPSGPGPYGAKQVRRVGSGIVHADVQDFDGDGLPDRPFDNTGDNSLWYVFYNNTDPEGDFLTSHKPDLLARIDSGIGGSVEITYQPSTKYLNAAGVQLNPNLPFPVQTVREVLRSDGTGPGNDMVTTMTYTGGFYEYLSREFRGFNTVTSEIADGTKSVTTFHQDGALKGKPQSVEVFEDQGTSPILTTETMYLEPDDPTVNLYASDGVLVALPQEITTTLSDPSGDVETAVQFAYDKFGNVTERHQLGLNGPGQGGDQRRACISYISPPPLTSDPYRVSYISEVFVTGGEECQAAEGQESLILSKTTFVYHQDASSFEDGFWITRSEYLRDNVHEGNETLRAINTMRAPDSYGNIASITNPRNFTTTILYDGDAGGCLAEVDTQTYTFPCAVQNAKMHWEKFVFKASLGKLEKRTDLNGHHTLFDYDDLGRVKTVQFQAASATGPTKLRDYFYPSEPTGPGGVWGDIAGVGASPQNVAVLDYADETTPTRPLGVQSQVFFDGLGRTILQRSDGDDQRAVDVETTYDNRGRVFTVSLPFFNDSPPNPMLFTTNSYDALGRITEVKRPNDTCTKVFYGGLATTTEVWGLPDCSPSNVRMRRISITNAYGDIKEIKEYPTLTEAYQTTYKYDALGNATEVRDACANNPTLCDSNRPAGQSHVTTIEYDTLSRKVRADDPSMGEWFYQYDDGGNLIWQRDAKLEFIDFEYDELDRLDKKDYDPTITTDDIIYNYDDTVNATGSDVNGIGRLTSVTDAAGKVFYGYDPRGNIDRFIRDFTTVNKRFEYIYSYDNLDRLTEAQYPKNDSGQAATIATYKYLSGTLQTPFVQAIEVDVGGTVREIVKDGTSYDAAGNLLSYVNGTGANGVKTEFTYNPATLQMATNKVTSLDTSAVFLEHAHAYDAATSNITIFQDVKNWFNTQWYMNSSGGPGYDGLGRLERANGPWVGPWPYPWAHYTYDAIGNLLEKDRIDDPTRNAGSKTLIYNHVTNPHAVTDLSVAGGPTRSYLYDFNGNMEARNTDGGPNRTYNWDQDNRLVSVVEGSTTLASFTYDYTGERVLAQAGTQFLYMPTRDFEWSGSSSANIYVFLGALRVASVAKAAFVPPDIPVGGWVAWKPVGRALGDAVVGLLPLLAMLLLLGLGRWWIKPGRAPAMVLVRRGGIGLLIVVFLVATSKPAQAVQPPYSGHWNHLLFYHSDYKGSTSLVTNWEQVFIQSIDYWPYGAMRANFIPNPNLATDVRHKFTSQELDRAIGIYYYGGRWYDQELGRFISPDPFVPDPKNPQSLNRYTYVLNNPTNLVDPNGYFFAEIFAFLGGIVSGVAQTVGFEKILVGTFDLNPVAFGLGRQMGLGLSGVLADAARIGGDFVLDRTLVPNGASITSGDVLSAIEQSVQRNQNILDADKLDVTKARLDVYKDGGGADIAGSDLAGQLDHRSILQRILSRIGGLFSFHDYVGFGSIANVLGSGGVGSEAQRIGNFVVFEQDGKLLIQQENSDITSVVGLSTHTVDTGQYVEQILRNGFQDQPKETGVTRGNAITRPIQNFVRKVRKFPVLNFFK